MAHAGFARNVLTLLSGTTFALAVPVLLSPALSRLFTPEHFGQLALFVSISAIGAVAATGRYELAVLIPRREQVAFALLTIAVLLSGAFSLFILAVLAGLFVVAPDLLAWVGPTPMWLLLLPASIFLTSSLQGLVYWQTRQAGYSVIAQARAAQALAMSAMALAAGWIGWVAAGLIAGHAFGSAVAVARIAKTTVQDLRRHTASTSLKSLLAAARHYNDFPKYLIVGHLANMASSQMPVLLLTAVYGTRVGGLYALVDRVLVVPCAVIANAIGEVYRHEAARQYRSTGACLDLFIQTTRKLALLGAVPALCAIVAAERAFPIVFGVQWAEAGPIAAMLGVMVFFQTLGSPMSQTVLLAGMYRLDLAWQIGRVVVAAAAFAAGHHLVGGYLGAIGLYIVAFAVFYLAHLALQYLAARGKHLGRAAEPRIGSAGIAGRRK
ncbi:oligosaccharide flippase family protein [Ramlibacter sp. AN1015]|uniref:lipopolysaccharide biosynthesis protein n=1 Tax=Ramlibacter sp. AN1015 TaxID=3133428 RepID=UPI0030C1070E